MGSILRRKLYWCRMWKVFCDCYILWSLFLFSLPDLAHDANLIVSWSYTPWSRWCMHTFDMLLPSRLVSGGTKQTKCCHDSQRKLLQMVWIIWPAKWVCCMLKTSTFVIFTIMHNPIYSWISLFFEISLMIYLLRRICNMESRNGGKRGLFVCKSNRWVCLKRAIFNRKK